MRYSVRDLVYIGMFGALWGVIEMTFGDLLHAIGPVPFRGTIVASLGLAVALTGRLFVPRRGATLMTGLVAALIKLLSPSGQAIPNVMIAILAESMLAELGLLLAGQARRTGFILAGALATSWNLVHPFVTNTLFYGRTVVDIFLSILESGAETLGLDASATWLVIGALLLVRMAMGAVGGWIAWDLGAVVKRRLGRATAVPADDEV